MSKFNVEFEGEEELQKLFKMMQTKGLGAVVAKSLSAVANEVLNESLQIVPVDTSTLKNSGKVDKPKPTAEGISVEVSYGGAASPYAEIVHENPNARHASGKSYHFLKIPFDKAKTTFSDDIKKRIVFYMRGA
jgi:hypothetical protein